MWKTRSAGVPLDFKTDMELNWASLTRVDVLNAVALVTEGARVSEVYPPVLAFADIPWRTAPAFRQCNGQRASLRNCERVVFEAALGAEILGSLESRN
jgi:hypothetical protein